jgi:tetratricopeptide (TPR) repeat protein
LGTYYELRLRYTEGKAACQYALDKLAADDDPLVLRTRVRANAWKAHFLRVVGKHEEAARVLAQNLAILDGPGLQDVDTRSERAFLLLELGGALLPTDRLAARRYYEVSLALYEELNDPWRKAQALAGLGMVTHHIGNFQDAMQFYRRSLDLYEQTGDPNAIAGIVIELGHNSLRQGLLEQGESYIRRGCKYYEQTGDRASVADSLLQLSRMYGWSGNFTKGISLSQEAQPIFQELGLLH